MTPKVTVIAWVNNQSFDHIRKLVESFDQQVYPHKELLIANLADWHPIKGFPGKQFQLHWDVNIPTVMMELVRRSEGEYCVHWQPGVWYHPHVLSLHANHTDTHSETRIYGDEELLSHGFYRRSYHLVCSGKSRVERMGGVGLVRRFGQVECEDTRYFYHSGNIGDIVYSLPAVKLLGGGFLFLGPDVRLPKEIVFRETMSRSLFNVVAPLARAQDYVLDTYFYSQMPKVNYDLNRFRTIEWTGQNIATMTLQGIGVEGKVFLDDSEPWLKVKDPVFGKPVVIHRSSRYQNRLFPWRRVLTKYHDNIEFVGLKEEHLEFCKEFGVSIPFYPTKDLLELANRIAGSKLFIGNQSCPCAVAEGLKITLVQETDVVIPNCKFSRDDAYYCFDGHVTLPDLGSLSTNYKEPGKWFRLKKKVMSHLYEPKEKVFYHSGDIGDIVYAMSVVKAMGGGNVVLGPAVRDSRGHLKPRVPVTRETYSHLEPLIRRQSYVRDVTFSEDVPKDAIDLNRFRHVDSQRANGFKFKSIVEMTRESAGLDPEFDPSAPWIESDDPIFVSDVVIHRSSRFHGREFPWIDVVGKYGKYAVFVGSKAEHKEFCERYGWVPHLPTPNLDFLARVIDGASLFIGNQSAPYAIAEGLKKSTVQEMSTEHPNCVYVRNNAVYGADKFVTLPDVENKFRENSEVWNSDLVSFYTTCKNRLEHLRVTLPKNLSNHAADENVEFVVLDYDSGDGLEEWIKGNMMGYIESGKLSYYRVTGYPKFQMSHSKNVAAKLTKGSILCNIDSDNETGHMFSEWLRKSVRNGRWAGTESFTDDFGGRQAFTRSDFYALAGFDEQLVGWGSDDFDIAARAGLIGLKCVEVPVVYKYSLSHSNELRSRYMEIDDKDKSNNLNLERAKTNHKYNVVRVNPGRWGVAVAEKNFTGNYVAV